MTLRSKLNAERSEATRARLLGHARVVFEKHGYGAASVTDIVNAAAVARGTFYIHFKSKREIFIAVVSLVREDLVAGQMRTAEGATTVHGAIRNAIEHYLKAYRSSARMISLIEEISISDKVVRAAWLETREALLDNTTHSLEQLRARGLADFHGSSRTLAVTIGGMVERMGFLRYVLGYRFGDEEFFSTITDAYVNGARMVAEYQLTTSERFDLGPSSRSAARTRRRTTADARETVPRRRSVP